MPWRTPAPAVVQKPAVIIPVKPSIDMNDPLIVALVAMNSDRTRKYGSNYAHKDLQDILLKFKFRPEYKDIIDISSPEFETLTNAYSTKFPHVTAQRFREAAEKIPASEKGGIYLGEHNMPNYLLKKIIEKGATTWGKIDVRKEALRKLLDERFTK